MSPAGVEVESWSLNSVCFRVGFVRVLLLITSKELFTLTNDFIKGLQIEEHNNTPFVSVVSKRFRSPVL